MDIHFGYIILVLASSLYVVAGMHIFIIFVKAEATLIFRKGLTLPNANLLATQSIKITEYLLIAKLLRSREIMDLVAFVHPSVCLDVRLSVQRRIITPKFETKMAIIGVRYSSVSVIWDICGRSAFNFHVN